MSKYVPLVPAFLGTYASDAEANTFLNQQGWSPADGQPRSRARVSGISYWDTALSQFKVLVDNTWEAIGPSGGGAGFWSRAVIDPDGAALFPTTSGDDVIVGSTKLFSDGDAVFGAVAMAGTERLRVVGDARIEGKLTVTGAIDPTHIEMAGQAIAPAPPAVGNGTMYMDSTTGKMSFLAAGGGALGITMASCEADDLEVGGTPPAGAEVARVSGGATRVEELVIDTEAAIQSTPGAGIGIVWVRSADNALLFTDAINVTYPLKPPVLQDEGAPVAGAPHTTYDFVGAGVTVTNAGAGKATVTIPGGAGGGAWSYVAGPPGIISPSNSADDDRIAIGTTALTVAADEMMHIVCDPGFPERENVGIIAELVGTDVVTNEPWAGFIAWPNIAPAMSPNGGTDGFLVRRPTNYFPGGDELIGFHLEDMIGTGAQNNSIGFCQEGDSSWNQFAGATVVGVAGRGLANKPNAAAALEVRSTTGGFLAPRMTTVQRNALGNIAGMIVFNTDLQQFQGNDGVSWNNL